MIDSAPADVDSFDPRLEMTNYAHRFGAHQARGKARELLHDAVAALAATEGGDTSLFAAVAQLVLARCGMASAAGGA